MSDDYEAVNHPVHYSGDTPYEVIKVIEAWGLDQNFCLGNCIKYVARAEKKGAKLEDLEKAAWYLSREIAKLKNAAFTAPEPVVRSVPPLHYRGEVALVHGLVAVFDPNSGWTIGTAVKDTSEELAIPLNPQFWE